MKNRQDDTYRVQPTYAENILPHCGFLNQKLKVSSSETGPKPP